MSNPQIEQWKLEQILRKDSSESSYSDQDNINRFTYKKIDSLKVIFNLKFDKLEIVAVLGDNREQIEQYYEGEFKIEDFPHAFEFYESTADFYEDIKWQISKKDDALQLRLQDDGGALLNLTLKIKKKSLPLFFRLEVKSLPQLMLHSRNLKKLIANNQQQYKLYQQDQKRQLQIRKQIGSIDEQTFILKKEYVDLMHRLNLGQKDLISQQQNNSAMMAQMMNKRMEAMGLYYQLVKLGYQFSYEWREKFEKMLNASNHKNKKHMPDSASQHSIEQNHFHNQKPIAGKGKMVSLEKEQKVKQVIVINSQTESVKEINMANQEQSIRNVTQTAKIENVPIIHKRKLQIGDEQSNKEEIIIEQSQESKMFSDAKPKQHQMLAGKSVKLLQENVSNKVQNHSKLNKSQGVFIISYEQDEKVQQQFEEKFGKSVKLDFSKTQNIKKYETQVINGRVFVQRVFDDKNFYHLCHKQPIIGHQNMQFTIINILKRDFTFGIMSRRALKTSRLEWAPNTSICWVGCTKTQFPSNHTNKKSLAQSDNVIVSVNIETKRIAFYINKNCEFQTDISDHIAKQCYFFIETATKGNKFSFVNK